MALNIIGRADSQALMPEEVSREIIQALPQASAARQLFRSIPMTRAQNRMPALHAFPVAYWVGGDTGLKQTTKQLWGNKYLNAAELAVIVPIPQTVFDDTDYDMWAEVEPRLVEGFGEKLDAAIFFGDDVPAEWTGVNGIVPDATTAGHVVTEGSTAQGSLHDLGLDISAAMEMVESSGFDVTGHAGPRRLRAKLRNIRATTGEAIYQTIAGNAPPTIYGDTYGIFGNGAWDGSVLDILGDYSQGIIGVRTDFNVEIFREGVISDDNGVVILNLMQQDSIAMRAVGRFAFVVANPITRQYPVYTDTDRYPFSVVNAA